MKGGGAQQSPQSWRRDGGDLLPPQLLDRVLYPLRLCRIRAKRQISRSAQVLDLFKLATAPVSFSPERLAAGPAEAGAWRKVDDLLAVVRDAEWTGSNNWAISPAKSGTGRALMASDPHRAHSVPPLRYMVHLTAPGIDATDA